MEAIVLAAGYSSRAKDFKMNLLLGNQTVLQRTIKHFEDFCSHIIVVGGYKIELIREQLDGFYLHSTLELVYNDRFDQGMFSSIQRGCQLLQEDKFFLTPGDYPLIQKETIQKLTSLSDEVLIPSYQGYSGHPIRLGKAVKRAIINGYEKDNLRNILKDFNKKYIDVEDPGILMDLDTPKDYRNLKKVI